MASWGKLNLHPTCVSKMGFSSLSNEALLTLITTAAPSRPSYTAGRHWLRPGPVPPRGQGWVIYGSPDLLMTLILALEEGAV